jgi:hypothetical protein
MREKAEIEAKKANWADQYDNIWSTRLESCPRLLTVRLEEIQHQMQLLRDHARGSGNGPEYRAYEKEQRALVREIADQTGTSSWVAVDLALVRNPITDYDVLVMEDAGKLHAVLGNGEAVAPRRRFRRQSLKPWRHDLVGFDLVSPASDCWRLRRP